MNWLGISRNIGYALLVSALFMFLSVLVSLINGNDSALAALMISFIITFIVGIFPFIFVRSTNAISLKEGYVIITLSWLLSFIFGMLPYALWGGPFSVANAWFESVSGFTTTGATILDNVEALPPSLLFWRSSTHFIGGLGVVVFLLLIIPGSSRMKMRLTNMEVSSLSKGAYEVRANRMVYIFAYVYLAMCGLAFICYLIAGMPLLDAICHAMSVSATGGFSTRNASIGAFDSRAIEGITMFFMYLSSLHFGLIFLTIINRSIKPLLNPITKFYTISVLSIAVLIGIGLKINGFCEQWGESLWVGLFQTLCASTTSGFGITDNVAWPMWMDFLILMMAVMCACAGSTSGGVKVDRILLFFKAIGTRIEKILHPSSVNEVHLGGKIIKSEDVVPHIFYLCLYGVTLAVSILLCSMSGMSDSNSFAASVTSLSNVGSAINEFGYMSSFNAAPVASKFILSFDMFLGRVEIYPILAVVAMIFDRRSR